MKTFKVFPVFVLLSFFSVSVYAQTKSPLEEIMVTAQKRVQNVQDIPVAVSAYSGDELTKRGISDMFDLQHIAPGLLVSHNQTATSSNFSIRGIGTSSNNFGLESSVGLYVDGVYRARQSSLINELADVEQVQVLRGPQGTLFGRNTPSGAILIDTVKPSHEEGGYIDLTVGDYDLFSFNGAVGGSLVEDVWAWRATVFGKERDGFVENAGQGEDLIGDRSRYGGRFQLLYTPNDVFTARLIADYSELDEICCAAVTKTNNFFSFAGTLGTDSLLTLLGGDVISESREEDYVMALNQLPVSQNEDKGISLQMDWQTDVGEITSITSFRDFQTIDDIDGDFSNVDLFSRINDSEQSSFSQELRFTQQTDKMEYVLGAYYFEQDVETFTRTSAGPAFNSFFFADPDVTGLLGAYDALNTAIGGILPPPSLNPLPAGSSARNLMTQDHKAYALFGQLDYDLSDEFTLTFGLRYTDEKKDLDGRFEQDNLGPALNLSDPFSLTTLAFPGWGYSGVIREIGARSDIDETLEDDQVTGTIKLTYQPDVNTTYYASYATGYKSGGTNTDRIDPAFETLFDSETAETFEFGLKKDMPDNNLRVNATVHFSKTKDLQTNSFAGAGFNLINAGEVEAKGLELEAWWYPTDTLSVVGAFIYNDAEYKDFDGANCQIASFFQFGPAGIDPGAPINPVTGFPDFNQGCDRTGEGIQNNPEEVFILSATKNFPFADGKEAYVSADYSYRSDQLHDGNNEPLKAQDGYGLLNMKVGLQFDDGDSELSLWVRNVTDEYYYYQAFDVPLQTGKINVYPAEPRMFGLNFRKNFN